MAQTNEDSLKTDTVPNLVNDTAFVATDTLTQSIEGDTLQAKTEESDAVISSKINYSASDSIDNDVINKKVYLYGNAKIQYEDITLTAARIVYDFESFTVHAEGVRDTADKWIGLPNFKQGTSDFTSSEMDYNFKSKKAYVKQVKTEIIDGYLSGERVKTVDNNNVIYIRKGEYCPCEDPNAKTRFKIGKLKVIKDKQIVTGPGYLTLGKIPTPLAFPFGFFPNSEERQAGLIIPSYGNGGSKGYFLNDLGFYLPINDYVDTKFLGDIYSRGSWGLENITRYQKRYKFTGGFGVQFNQQVTGDRDLNNYSETNNFFINWNHTQDMKARPNSNFSASVNAGSSNTFRNDLNASQQDFLTNTFKSSITYNKSFYDSPWSFTAKAGHEQNSRTEIYKFTLPEVSINRGRTMPLDGLFNDNPKQQFYEKLGVTYSANFRNELSVKESQISLNNWPELKKDFKNGIQQNAGVSMPLNAGPITITPSFSYVERWYFKTYGRKFNEDIPGYEVDTINGFDRNNSYKFNTSVSTKLYGMYSFRTGALKAIRHTLTPSIGYSLNPEFDPNIYGFYGTNGTLSRYSPYENSIYSWSGSGRSETLNFSLSNNLEAKVLSRRDTTSKFKKVPIIENISFNGSYNFAADSLNLSPIRMSGRTKITKYAILTFSGSFEPYTYVATDEGAIRRINVFLRESTGPLASFESGQISLNGSGFGSEMYGRNKKGNTIVPEGGEGDNAEIEVEGEGVSQGINIDPLEQRQKGLFEDFSIPWHLNFGYVLTANRGRDVLPLSEGYALVDSINLIQTLQFSGDFRLFNRVTFRFNSGYDFVNKKMSTTTIFMTVDLNCWEFSARYIPFGIQKSYMVTLNIKSSLLRDLKFENKGNFGASDQFYQ